MDIWFFCLKRGLLDLLLDPLPKVESVLEKQNCHEKGYPCGIVFLQNFTTDSDVACIEKLCDRLEYNATQALFKSRFFRWLDIAVGLFHLSSFEHLQTKEWCLAPRQFFSYTGCIGTLWKYAPDRLVVTGNIVLGTDEIGTLERRLRQAIDYLNKFAPPAASIILQFSWENMPSGPCFNPLPHTPEWLDIFNHDAPGQIPSQITCRAWLKSEHLGVESKTFCTFAEHTNTEPPVHLASRIRLKILPENL